MDDQQVRRVREHRHAAQVLRRIEGSFEYTDGVIASAPTSQSSSV
jgi:hypothetical protein